MDPEVDQVISRVEQALQRDWIITSSFQEIKDGQRNYKRICILFLLQFLRCLFMLQYMVCVFADDDSSWNFYALNYYLGFGVFGRILEAMLFSGYGLVFVHVCAFSFFEWKAKLVPLTDLRDMFSRLKNPSQEEVK